MLASLKKATLTPKAMSTARSRWRIRSGRRGSTNGAMKSTVSAIHTSGELTLRPNAPGYPRAIVHATCGPVQASVTRPVSSLT